MSRSGRLEVEFASVLLRPTLAVRAAVALGDSVDWQNARPVEEDAWTLVGEGVVSRALPRAGVSVRPNPFNAASGAAQIQIDLAKVQHPQALTVALYDLAGRQRRVLWDGHRLRPGASAWRGMAATTVGGWLRLGIICCALKSMPIAGMCGRVGRGGVLSTADLPSNLSG